MNRWWFVEPCWGLTQHHKMLLYILPSEWRQAKSRTPRVTFSTYVSRVDGLQAAEDVTKLWGSWLQVREVPRPLGCQGFLTVELSSKGQTRWQWAFGDFIQTGGKLKEIQTKVADHCLTARPEMSHMGRDCSPATACDSPCCHSQCYGWSTGRLLREETRHEVCTDPSH